MPTPLKPSALWVLTSALLVLLLVLASMQTHWLNEVREADRKKTLEVLQSAVDRFAEDFDRELTRAFLMLQPSSFFRPNEGEDFAQKYERWRASAPFPDIVRDIFVARSGGAEGFELTRFDPASGGFEAAIWPADLATVQSRIADGFRRRRGRLPERRRDDEHPPTGQRPERRTRGDRPAPPDFELSFLVDEAPALVAPLFMPPSGPGRPPGPTPFENHGYLVLWLDLPTMTEEILPQLTTRYLRFGDGTDYNVQVLAGDGKHRIFADGPLPSAIPFTEGGGDRGDASAPLFSLLPAEKLRTLKLDDSSHWSSRDASAEAAGEPPRRAGRRHGEARRRLQRFYRFLSDETGARWRVVASHPSGSLDAAIASAHRNNLAVSFGILLLLAASLILVLLSTRRLQALARQQLEFTASVTHELLTPLAAMRSAGQNLADGVVTESPQVKRYGRLIEDEGRRLTNMVGQVLEFAGIQAGRREYSLRRTSLPEIIESALDEYRSVLEEKGFAIETQVEDDLPQIMADPAALKRALQNLIANAVKYGAAGSWIGIEARQAPSQHGPELRLSVADRGPGIATGDLSRLFEPFFRGRNGVGDQIPGSGLGLSLVRHIALGHGGRVSIKTDLGSGSNFTIHLPAAADDEEGSIDET